MLHFPMPRPRYHLLAPPVAHYHCISRVVDRNYVFGTHERDVFRKILRQVEEFSGVRVITWTILSNHFHLLLEVAPRPAIPPTDSEIIDRCRAELPPCSDDESRRELALAFLIEALHSWVDEGVYDGVAVANARRLDPEMAARWEAQFPVGSDPADAWVAALVPPPTAPAVARSSVELRPRSRRTREPVTLGVQFAARPFPCRTSSLPSSNGDGRFVRDCPVDLGGALRLDVRAPGGFLLRLGASGRGWWTDDSLLLHLMVDTLAELPLSGYYAEARAAIGVALPAGPGELRVAGGGVIGLSGVGLTRIEELYRDHRVAPPYLSSTSLSGWFSFEWEAQVEEIRLEPQIRLEVGNEVGWRWRLAQDDLNTYTRNLDADVESLVAGGFGLAVPTSAPVAFRVDMVAGVEIDQYSEIAAERGRLAQPRLTDTWTSLPRTEFFFHLAVGVEARIGRPRAVDEAPYDPPERRPGRT